MSNAERRSPGPKIALIAAIACIAAAAVATLLTSGPIGDRLTSPIIDDPGHYRVIGDAVLDGGVPYLDDDVEHLPGALAAMVLVALVASWTGIGYTTLWAIAMSACVVISAVLLGLRIDEDHGRSFVLLGLPLLPVVLYRVEPWLVVWVVLAIVTALAGQGARSSAAAAVATTIKGWPIVLFALPWRGGARRAALVGAGVSGAIVAATAITDGFRDPRAYTGIHTETLAGSSVLVIRHMTGAALELVPSAGAAYVDVAIGVVVLNAAVGIFFVLGGAWLGWSSTDHDLVRALGVVTAGIMLASPLLSAQFVYWLIPFAIFFANERSRLVTILVGVLTLLVVVAWSPTDAWWAWLTLGRNVALVALAATWLMTVAGAAQRPAASTSRKNLPV